MCLKVNKLHTEADSAAGGAAQRALNTRRSAAAYRSAPSLDTLAAMAAAVAAIEALRQEREGANGDSNGGRASTRRDPEDRERSVATDDGPWRRSTLMTEVLAMLSAAARGPISGGDDSLLDRYLFQAVHALPTQHHTTSRPSSSGAASQQVSDAATPHSAAQAAAATAVASTEHEDNGTLDGNSSAVAQRQGTSAAIMSPSATGTSAGAEASTAVAADTRPSTASAPHAPITVAAGRVVRAHQSSTSGGDSAGGASATRGNSSSAAVSTSNSTRRAAAQAALDAVRWPPPLQLPPGVDELPNIPHSFKCVGLRAFQVANHSLALPLQG
jgi:hypothetical protein